jgi:putative DNA primase/helicase
MSDREASDRLGYTAKSAGIWLEGINGFGQFRPNKPWKGENDKKAPKYRTATGEEYDAMLPHHPTNSQYWQALEALKALCYSMNGHPCLLLTEGLFKAIAACSQELPCVALCGVEQGLTSGKDDVQGKRYLVPTLEHLARHGFGFIIVFDADEKKETKENVAIATRKLAQQLVKFKVPIYVGTGIWTPEQGKGLDDFIKLNGVEAFRQNVLNKVIDFSAWDQQFNKEEVSELTAKGAAQSLTERYRTLWKYDLQQQTWRRYNNKIWEQTPDKVFEKSVYHDLEMMPNAIYDNYSYVENVVKFLELELQERSWTSFNRAEWIAFNDCVLEVATGKYHDHAPGFMFTSRLDHDCPKLKFDQGGDLLELVRLHAPNFFAWATYAQGGDAVKILKLLAIFNAVLTYRFFDLQMFVLLCGVPGSGKGTYARLLEGAVGRQNHASAKMHRLGEDNVIANIIDKQLVVCPDEKKQLGDNSGILSLCGGDNIPYRQIYKPMSSARFYGALVVVANSNPFMGDTTGIDRRWSLVQFDKALPVRDTSVERQMQQELGMIISLALAMTQQQVTSLIKGTGEGSIPDFKRQQWLHKTENDSIALFMEEILVPTSADRYLLLGAKGDDPSSLYGAYVKMCDENNTRNLFTKNNFCSHLLEVCREVGWTEVKKVRCQTGWRIYGVGIRDISDNSQRISDWLAEDKLSCRPCKPCVDTCVDPKPSPSKDYVDYVDLELPKNKTEDHQQPMVGDESSNVDRGGGEVYIPTQPMPGNGSGSTQGSTQVCTAYISTHEDAQTNPNVQNPETVDNADTQPILTLSQKIARYRQWELGNYILEIADTDQLRSEIKGCGPQEIKKIKDAANACWQPQINQFADYEGDRVEVWATSNQSREVEIRTSGNSKPKIKRDNLRPWLGI